MTGRMQMLRQFLVGAAVSACNIMIHALVMIAVVRLLKTADAKDPSWPWLFLTFVMVATVSVLTFGHACEVIVWSLCYALVGAAPAGADRIFRIRELHDARLRRRHSGAALATAWADNCDEWRADV